MHIVAMFMPKAVPKSYTTTETRCSYKNKYATVIVEDETTGEMKEVRKLVGREMVKEEVESKGGLLFKFPRGHSIRLTDPAQIEQFRLSADPKLVDLDTGEEVDEQGKPKSLAAVIRGDGIMNSSDFGEAPVARDF